MAHRRLEQSSQGCLLNWDRRRVARPEQSYALSWTDAPDVTRLGGVYIGCCPGRGWC